MILCIHAQNVYDIELIEWVCESNMCFIDTHNRQRSVCANSGKSIEQEQKRSAYTLHIQKRKIISIKNWAMFAV